MKNCMDLHPNLKMEKAEVLMDLIHVNSEAI
jgi:hypothetical protein